MERITNLGAARKASGLYQQECADIMNISLPTYRKAEEDDNNLRIGEIKMLLPHLNKISRKIIKDGIDEIFLM